MDVLSYGERRYLNTAHGCHLATYSHQDALLIRVSLSSSASSKLRKNLFIVQLHFSVIYKFFILDTKLRLMPSACMFLELLESICYLV